MRHSECDPLERMRTVVLEAKGNVVTLKPKALCRGGRAVAKLLKTLAEAGYLEAIGSGKYLLRRSSPLWKALERGEAAKLLEQLRNRREPQNRSRKRSL